MWIRLRIDVGWSDLIMGLAYCALPSRRSIALENARRAWNDSDDFLITLSVRSAFDLTLRALQLPHGSEVLLSALTVPDMARIVRAHGLVPVPLDTDEAGHLDVASLRQAISSRSRMVVVAHLFGGYAPLDEVIALAKERDLLVVEDCAQCFRRVGDSGHAESDVALFSFGPIKTASAMGGAVARVKSHALRQKMAALLESDPIQSRVSFANRIARFGALKSLSGPKAAAFTKWCTERIGCDFDSMANASARGFAASKGLGPFRQQPCAPLLRLMERRWRTYDYSRIDQRIQLGRYLDSRLGLKRPASYTYWVYPIFVDDPISVRDRLVAEGFDATCKARMSVVPATENSNEPVKASRAWKRVVFLPWYPDLPMQAVRQMADAISTVGE